MPSLLKTVITSVCSTGLLPVALALLHRTINEQHGKLQLGQHDWSMQKLFRLLTSPTLNVDWLPVLPGASTVTKGANGATNDISLSLTD